MTTLRTALAVALVATLAGCGDSAVQGPTTQEMQRDRAKLAARMKDKDRRTKSVVVVQGDEAGGFGALSAGFSYEPEGKRDPFRSFRWERHNVTLENRGPLEQFELEQLAVVAVIWSTGRPRALVADPAGNSYIVRQGTPIGKNDGRVIHIGDNLVLVKETYVDFAGAETTKDVELRIRRSQGG